MREQRYPILIVVLITILIAGVLSGCGTPEPATVEETEAAEGRATATNVPPATEEASAEEDLPETAGDQQSYSAPPAMEIDPEKFYVATIQTEEGEITVELLPEQAPKTVNNFVFLAREGFYDDTTFHRVIPGFMAQGGDPTGTGMGGPGYTFEDEFSPQLAHDRLGTLSMANSGPNTNGSQFFITYAPTPWLDNRHTVFGRVIGGLETLFSLSPRDPEEATAPGDTIESVTITERDTPPTPEIPPNEELPLPEEPQARNAMYPRPPAMEIDPEVDYRATIVTSKGEIVVDLNAEAAPVTVNNFVFLAQQGFYDGLTFHRVEPGFVIQGGDPTGTGQGGPGYLLPPEIGLEHVEGAIAMARLPDQGNPRRMSSGSQFYITLDSTPQLDGEYTVFGQVIEGMDVVQSIQVGDVIEEISISTQ
jgi:peptidylprolyl isomerase/peptidyl-prolyl cis-trans isomerase B (cyclophilin B)